MKDRLGSFGRQIDTKIEETKRATAERIKKTQTDAASKSVKLAKMAGKRIAEAGKGAVAYVGDSLEKQIKKGGEKIKRKLEIDNNMSAGQKAGKVVEKVVDVIAAGMKTVGKKIEESQSTKFASPMQLKMKGFEELIGEERDSAIAIERAEACKQFVNILGKKLSSKKDTTKEIIKDAIRSASTTPKELLDYLSKTKTGNTKAEVDYINKEINELAQKFVKEVKDGEE